MRIVLATVAATGLSATALALGATDYLGVAPPKVTSAPPLAGTECAACHGADGVAPVAAFPTLAGQNYNYLLKALETFRDGTWKAEPMAGVVATIPHGKDNQHIKQLAGYFSQLPLHHGPNAAKAPAKDVLQAGYKIYFEGPRTSAIPACAACHLASGLGNAPMAVPRLAGQNAAYVVAELKAFAAGKRQTGPDAIMHKVASRLDAQQMQAVATYVHAMQPALLPGGGMKTYAAFTKALAGQTVPGVPSPGTAAAQP